MKSALHTRWWPTVFSMFDQFWKVGIVSFAFSDGTTARASRFRIFCETYIIIYIIINDVLSHNPACDVTRGFAPNGDLSRLLLSSALIFPHFFFFFCFLWLRVRGMNKWNEWNFVDPDTCHQVGREMCNRICAVSHFCFSCFHWS